MPNYADIMRRFMQGEIDAASTATQIKALPKDARVEYVLWPEETFTREYIESKISELEAAYGPEPDDPAA